MDYVKYHERRTLVWTIKVVVCGCLWLFVALSAWPWTAPVQKQIRLQIGHMDIWWNNSAMGSLEAGQIRIKGKSRL